MRAFEYEIEIHGERRWKESRMIPSGPDEAVTIVRDFTEQRRAEAGQRRLAAEQAALRRVATLVAGNAPPAGGVPERDGGGVPPARPSDRRPGAVRDAVDGDDRRQVRRPARPVRARLRRSARAGSNPSRCSGPTPRFASTTRISRTRRCRSFSISATAVRSAFRSRLRVRPGERSSSSCRRTRPSRRRPSTGSVRSPSSSAWPSRAPTRGTRSPRRAAGSSRRATPSASASSAISTTEPSSGWSPSRSGCGWRSRSSGSRPTRQRACSGSSPRSSSAAIVELRELAQGIHPAVLTERGLGAAVEVLAARAPLSVELDIDLPERLPEPVETAAYYAV